MHRISRHLVSVTALLTVVLLAAPALAQTGGLRGKVTDAQGAPVEGAIVKIEGKSTSRKAEVKTNKKGEYIQIGLFPGDYKVTVEKGGMSISMDTRVALGDPTQMDLSLKPQAGQPNPEQAERDAKLRGLFEAGVTAVQAGNYDDAIAKFTEATTMLPTCHVCYYNIGAAYAKKAQAAQGDAATELWAKTEENYKKSVELKPDYSDGWAALAALYNQQKKFDLAAQASEKASGPAGAAGAPGGGSAPALYNQGVIFWNQNKYNEAKDKFDAATKADPKYSEAWYRLGMAYMNLGDTKKAVESFEGYLQNDPNGSHAAEVKQAIDALKPKQ
jgi:tetratricopeptide (TPR) repeat protein